MYIVHKGGAWLEILGVNLEDSNSYVCLGGHSRGYLTKTYNVMVIEDIGTFCLSSFLFHLLMFLFMSYTPKRHMAQIT